MASELKRSDWLPLRTVSRLTGLTPDLIRAWERRYGVVQPVRGPRGARVYSLADVRRLRLLAQAVEEGRAIGDVARLSPAELEKIVRRVPEEIKNSAGVVAPADVPQVPEPLEREFWLAIQSFERERLERVLGQALAIWPLETLATAVLSHWLEQVGERWSRGELSIAHEHFVSATLRDFLGQLVRTRRVSGAPEIVFATPQGEEHEFGLLLAALLVADRSIPALYLGTNVPEQDLLAAIRSLPVRVLAVSVVNEENRQQAIAWLRKVLRASGPLELWLGGRDAEAVGRAFRAAPVRVLAHLRDLLAALEGVRRSL